MLRMQARHVPSGVAAFHDVVPRTAVHMQVDEAGQHDGRTALAHLGLAHRLAGDAGNAAVCAHVQAAVHKAGGGEDVALQRGGAHGVLRSSATKA